MHMYLHRLLLVVHQLSKLLDSSYGGKEMDSDTFFNFHHCRVSSSPFIHGVLYTCIHTRIYIDVCINS